MEFCQKTMALNSKTKRNHLAFAVV